jgi:hypothetical protein
MLQQELVGSGRQLFERIERLRESGFISEIERRRQASRPACNQADWSRVAHAEGEAAPRPAETSPESRAISSWRHEAQAIRARRASARLTR